MLSKEDNELLTRTGPGTLMGQLMRQFWIPLLTSEELSEPDGKPLRVRVLGEDLVAFRDTAGQVGLLGTHCPHRGAALYYGRNEEHGLRCVWHGWKFDISGRCVDLPNEPRQSTFKDRIRHLAYPCVERGGVIWVYMGKKTPPPSLPEFEWIELTPAHRIISKRYQQCNWLQALEGGIDPSHASFLHASLDGDASLQDRAFPGLGKMFESGDAHPVIEAVDRDYGVLIGARRDYGPDHYLWRISHFFFPFFNMAPPGGPDPVLHSRAWVPMDDEHTMTWSFSWHPLRPLTESERDAELSGWGIHEREFLPATPEPGGNWRTVANKENDYLWDWELQRRKYFFGVKGIAMQDQAIQESCGPIYDRTQEHLVSGDFAIIQVRNRLLKAAKRLADDPEAVLEVPPAAFRVRAAGVILPRNVSWVEGARDYLIAHKDKHFASA